MRLNHSSAGRAVGRLEERHEENRQEELNVEVPYIKGAPDSGERFFGLPMGS
jgi:hypothetical protein